MHQLLKQRWWLLALLTFIVFFSASCSSADNIEQDLKTDNPAIFELVSPEQSGIHFNNTLKENIESEVSRFHFDYFYNGAGVGVAEFIETMQ